MTEAPPNGVQTADTDDLPFDAENAFLKNLLGGEADASTETDKDKDKTTETTTTEETPEDGAETEADASEKTETEKTEDEPAKSSRTAADDDEVIIQVGEETIRTSVRDLKRLAGQERALTQKSQAVAEQRKTLDAEAQKYGHGLQTMAQQAATAWSEYEKIDYLAAKDALDPTAFARLREAAQTAWNTHQFYQKELADFSTVQAQRQQEALRAQAQETYKVITDPASKHHIEGWSDQTYSEILKFAVEDLGAPREVVANIADAWALKALHLAAQQAKAAKALAAASKTPAQPAPKGKPTVKASPSKVLTSTETPSNRSGDRKATALNRLHRTGSVDDAAEAFLASWGAE